MTIVYYVSGHGLGHADRACHVMNALPRQRPLVVCSSAAEEFFRRALRRPFEFRAVEYDSGAAQESNFSIDWPLTLANAMRAQARFEEAADAERHWLASTANAVVTDVTPGPLRLAAEAGIPGICVGNFTWVEPFSAGLRCADGRALVQACRNDYARATLLLRTPLCFPMRYFPARRDIPLITRAGNNIRARLERELGARGRRIVLVYLGTWGHADADLSRLAAIPGVLFVSFQPMPGPIERLNSAHWDFHDVLASSDAVVCKAGYGTVAACMAAGVPLVTYPRPEFSEYKVLRRGLIDWGGGIVVPRREIVTGRWEGPIMACLTLRPRRLEASGAAAAARAIEAACEGARL